MAAGPGVGQAAWEGPPRPDALGCWAEHGQQIHFMLEYDTGSEHLPQRARASRDFRLALLTGARRGELCGLRWAGTDLDHGTLVIDHTVLELNGKLTEGTPKTKAGERRLFVGPQTAALLRRHREAQELERMVLGPAWTDNDLVFCREDGQPYRPGYVSKKWRELASAAGLPPVKLHAARHAAISAMRALGIDKDLRKKAVGHSSDTVHDKYTHYQDAALREAASQAEQHVTGGAERA